jgi:hypothetical protein
MMKKIEKRRESKLQSAMEYLMTYGWAILIIAVVLAVLFSLGIFSGGSLLGTSCVAVSGYLCQSPILSASSNGMYPSVLTFQLGQNTGNPVYNVFLSCAATADSSGLPRTTGTSYNSLSPVTNAFFSLDTATGNVMTGNPISGSSAISGYSGNELYSGQTITVTNLPCYDSNGNVEGATGTVPIGTAFSGHIWMAYSTTNTGQASTFAQIASLSVKQS